MRQVKRGPNLEAGWEKIENKFEDIENFWDDPGCFGGYSGVIPEYFYGIFEGF